MERNGKERRMREQPDTKKGCVGMRWEWETEKKRKKGSFLFVSITSSLLLLSSLFVRFSLTFPLRCFAYWTTNSCASTSFTVFGAYLVPSSAMVASKARVRSSNECCSAPSFSLLFFLSLFLFLSFSLSLSFFFFLFFFFSLLSSVFSHIS